MISSYLHAPSLWPTWFHSACISIYLISQIKVVFVTAGLAHQKGHVDLERREAPFITKGVEYEWEKYRFDMIPLYIG